MDGKAIQRDSVFRSECGVSIAIAANAALVTAHQDFSMVEVMSGLMLPLIRGSLPDFGPPFEQYAADLKREAERA